MSSRSRYDAAVAAPSGVAARPPRGVSEDTDEVAADTTPEFREASKAVIIVDICCRAEDRTA